MEADIFNKYALAIVAIISMIVGPLLQWRIAKRQADLQERLAKRQVADSIAARRQAWINDLRADIARLLMLDAMLTEIQQHENDEKSESEKSKELEAYLEALRESEEVTQRIVLRLNPKEDAHIELEDSMEELERMSQKIDGNSSDQEKQARKDVKRKVIDQTRAILKSEWERVKRGEV